MNFKLWKSDVDILFALFFFGLTSEDFDDYLWHDAFDEGLTPEEAFEQWKEDCFDFD